MADQKDIYAGIFKEDELGTQTFVTFKSDKNVKIYKSEVLNIMPVLKIPYIEEKKTIIEIEDKYMNILPWIVSIYYTKNYTDKIKELDKINKLREIDICTILDFINQYMVDNNNKFEDLCIKTNHWFKWLIVFSLSKLSNDNEYTKFLYETIHSKCSGIYLFPYETLFDKTIKEINDDYIKGRYKVRGAGVLLSLNTETTKVYDTYDANFNFTVIERLPEKYKCDFLLAMLKDISEKSKENVVLAFIKK
jgi:hypothetical protein